MYDVHKIEKEWSGGGGEGSGYVGLSRTLESVRNVIATRSGHVDMSVNGSRFVDAHV